MACVVVGGRESSSQAVRERVSSAAFGCQRSTPLAQADQAYMALMEIVCSLDDYLQAMQVRSLPRQPANKDAT